MFIFGIVMALVGAVVPALSEQLSLTLSGVGTLFLVMNFAMLLASLGLGLIVDRFGLRLPLVGGAWLVAVALVRIGGAAESADLLPAVASLGFGGGALNGAANTLVADLHARCPGRKRQALKISARRVLRLRRADPAVRPGRADLDVRPARSCSTPSRCCAWSSDAWRFLCPSLLRSRPTSGRWRRCRRSSGCRSCWRWPRCCSSSPATSSCWAATLRRF